nr:MAG TPA: hypothetical protein [Caudoviricetes sp.]
MRVHPAIGGGTAQSNPGQGVRHGDIVRRADMVEVGPSFQRIGASGC